MGDAFFKTGKSELTAVRNSVPPIVTRVTVHPFNMETAVRMAVERLDREQVYIDDRPA